ncbi:MAG: hypothetical protein HYV60_02360 [Planctomycetia bacterium]|nr:hypothetical protein [Planctomycetia bacterium]
MNLALRFTRRSNPPAIGGLASDKCKSISVVISSTPPAASSGSMWVREQQEDLATGR